MAKPPRKRKKMSNDVYTRKTAEQRKAWWDSLTPEQQSERIEKWERTRKKNRKDNTGKVETWTNHIGHFTKVWLTADSYRVTFSPTKESDAKPRKQPSKERRSLTTRRHTTSSGRESILKSLTKQKIVIE